MPPRKRQQLAAAGPSVQAAHATASATQQPGTGLETVLRVLSRASLVEAAGQGSLGGLFLKPLRQVSRDVQQAADSLVTSVSIREVPQALQHCRQLLETGAGDPVPRAPLPGLLTKFQHLRRLGLSRDAPGGVRAAVGAARQGPLCPGWCQASGAAAVRLQSSRPTAWFRVYAPCGSGASTTAGETDRVRDCGSGWCQIVARSTGQSTGQSTGHSTGQKYRAGLHAGRRARPPGAHFGLQPHALKFLGCSSH